MLVMAKNVWNQKWVRLKRLSKGGQGLTYRARRLEDSEHDEGAYVLKELKDQRDPERRARMYQEVANLRILEGEGIAHYVDANAERFKEDEDLYLVTEYIPGPTLAEFVKDSPQEMHL